MSSSIFPSLTPAPKDKDKGIMEALPHVDHSVVDYIEIAKVCVR